MLWCLSWGVLCCYSMAKEDTSAAIQWMHAAGVTKVTDCWRREVWVTWVIRTDCSVLSVFFCLSSLNLARRQKCNKSLLKHRLCVQLQDQVVSVQRLKIGFVGLSCSTSDIYRGFFHWIGIKEEVVFFLTKEVIQEWEFVLLFPTWWKAEVSLVHYFKIESFLFVFWNTWQLPFAVIYL